MSYGLRVWDASGNLTLDVTNRITRIISSHGFSIAANSSQAISVPGITTDGTWIAYAPLAPCTINSGSVTVYNRFTSTLSGTLLVLRL